MKSHVYCYGILMYLTMYTTIIFHMDLMTISFCLPTISSMFSLPIHAPYCSHSDLSEIWI